MVPFFLPCNDFEDSAMPFVPRPQTAVVLLRSICVHQISEERNATTRVILSLVSSSSRTVPLLGYVRAELKLRGMK